MKYSKAITEAHPVAVEFDTCIASLDELVCAEDESCTKAGNQFQNVCVINLDCVEAAAARNDGNRNRNSTMDCTFAISDGPLTEMLLVEFRFNYTNLKNLNRQKLMDKVSGSNQLLLSCHPIADTYAFIFQKGLVEQARSRLSRMNPRVPNNFVSMDLDGLHQQYFM